MENKIIKKYVLKIRGLIFRLFKSKLSSEWILRPYLNKEQRTAILTNNDPIRYGSFLLAMEQLEKENIFGSFAECGVYKGTLSKFIHDFSPKRHLFLFDTFKGFDERDSDSIEDSRFQDTSEEIVLKYIGNNNNNITIKKGYFPETISDDVKNAKFALVIIDFDKYDPTLAALNFFYPLLSSGGFIFVHDYSSPESDWACSRALNIFLKDKPEYPILIPDTWGSAIIRKI